MLWVCSVLLLTILISITLFGCGTGSGPTSIPDRPETPELPPPVNLIWSEEFNGNSLDTSVWNYELGASGWGNNEWQEYTSDPANIRVEGGNLVITARCDSGVCGSQDGSITSARINTKNKFTFQYGTIQARIKAPPGQGMWAAFWMMGSNIDTDGWPACGEVDIMEIFDGASTNDKVHTVVHWDDGGHVFEGGSKQFAAPMSDDFHTYEVEWNDTQVIGRVDGQQFFVKTINPTTMSELLNDYFLLLNVAVGGNLGGVPVTNQVWAHDMQVDWIRIYSDTVPPPIIPPVPGNTAGIYSETTYDATIPYSQIVNSADWSGNITVPNDTSTAVTPVDGTYVLSADYQLGITDWGGIALSLDGADMTPYSTLAFSIDSSAIATFDDLKIEIEDSSATKASVQLASYVPTTSANWQYYEIPLSAFAGANLASVNYLGLYSPVDVGDNLLAGTLYFDNIYLFQGCVGSGDIMLKSAAYAHDDLSTTFNVADFCSADSTVSVDLDNGTDTVSVDVALDANGHGTSTINFGATNDASDTIAVFNGDTLTATYTDANSNVLTDAGAIEGDGPRVLTGDANSDGLVYVYASDPSPGLDLVVTVDYAAIDTWSSGSVHDNNYIADPDYSPVFQVVPGSVWDPPNYAGAVAFTGFTAGFATPYTTLHFKFKGNNYSSVFVKFSTGGSPPELQKEYRLSSAQAESFGNGWYDFSIRLADFPGLAPNTEFAILNFGSDTFYLTDIYFD